MHYPSRLCSLMMVLLFVSCGKKDATPTIENAPPSKEQVQAITKKTWRDFVFAIEDLKLEIQVTAYRNPPNAAEMNISAIHTYINAVKEVRFEGCDAELATFLSTYPRQMEEIVRDGLFSESRGDNVKKQAAVMQFNLLNSRIRELAQTLSTRYGQPFKDPWAKQ